jgi:hypothetical protein
VGGETDILGVFFLVDIDLGNENVLHTAPFDLR